MGVVMGQVWKGWGLLSITVSWMMSMSMEVEMISLILDDEHVNGYWDEGDKGWLPASVVADD